MWGNIDRCLFGRSLPCQNNLTSNLMMLGVALSCIWGNGTTQEPCHCKVWILSSHYAMPVAAHSTSRENFSFVCIWRDWDCETQDFFRHQDLFKNSRLCCNNYTMYLQDSGTGGKCIKTWKLITVVLSFQDQIPFILKRLTISYNSTLHHPYII